MASDRAALAHFPSLAGLPADATVQEIRSAIIGDLEAAGLSLRRIGKVLGCSIAEVRADRAIPPRRPARGRDDGD